MEVLIKQNEIKMNRHKISLGKANEMNPTDHWSRLYIEDSHMVVSMETGIYNSFCLPSFSLLTSPILDIFYSYSFHKI